MTDTTSPKFDDARRWIRNARAKGIDWDTILLKNQENEEELHKELTDRIENDFWPDELNIHVWKQIVKTEEDSERERKEISIREDKAMLTDKSEDSGVTVPGDKYSSWVLYKEYLQQSSWKKDSIEEMESATLQILKRLKIETVPGEAVKGLVVGHVQSGKTANMAALMAMAADWGWNMFIVLSGTIENLRKQTQSRLRNDLNRHGNIVWSGLEHLSLNATMNRLQDLSLEKGSRMRYFTVCLKNPTRLENLIRWMQADKNKLSQLKIIVIDDESDQGSINTLKSKELRSKINGLLVNLVHGKQYNGKMFDGAAQAMNYIGYTATPYANFLNESHPKSLYPSSFIRTLQPSRDYFGAKQIFGTENVEEQAELEIIRHLDERDVSQLKRVHQGSSFELPANAVNSLAWFLCASSAMRLAGYKKSISMLVHTSQKQNHHSHVAEAIETWLKQSDKNEILKKCQKVWEYETEKFSVESFKIQFPEYPDHGSIKDYPSFTDLKKGILNLVEQLTHIQLGEDMQPTYHTGIHLCIDNCSNNGINEENMFVRLAYPDSSLPNYPSPAPVFIVVGGSTLSRGLTIEGLVSTLFLRASNQADTLMQMGRWFGYRKGYELYPRIWMTETTQDKFKFLAQMEQELRDDLRRYMDAGADPSEYGPRILASPKVSWMRATAANRMQNAVPAEMDFSGTNAQTVVFSEKREILLHNIKTVDEFLHSLGDGVLSSSESSIVWRNIPFEKIKEGLLVNKYNFHERASVFNNMDAFCDWYEKSAEEAGYKDWNIIVAGTKEVTQEWMVPGGSVGKINRSRLDKKTHDSSLSIGVLRAPKDLFEDIEKGAIDEELLKERSKSADNEAVRRTRETAGLELTPLLILYRIDKDSKAPEAKKSGNQRLDLNVPEDIIGMSMWIPGVKSKSLVKTVTVRINKDDRDIEDETGDSNAD